MMKYADAGALSVAYEEWGAHDGWTAILLHGFPYDVHTYHEVASRLAVAGAHVIVPYLRGFGPTRFLFAKTPRSGQQAALGADVIALMDSLSIASAILAGYDWGGRAACVAAALDPGRVRGLVSCNGYNIQNIAKAADPAPPEEELRYWYQYYFHGERGRAGLTRNRHAFCRLLWKLWSPTWEFSDEMYERSAVAFDNLDFVEVVIHSYRHRFGLARGDAALESIEQKLAQTPTIDVPTISIDGAASGIMHPGGSGSHARYFTKRYEHRTLANVGHNVPQEAPEAFADAVLTVRVLGNN